MALVHLALDFKAGLLHKEFLERGTVGFRGALDMSRDGVKASRKMEKRREEEKEWRGEAEEG